MVSKESEYLIHLAEEQLERLNKSLYFYQRTNDIQDDLLEYNSDRFDHESTNLSLTPIYAIIDRQRQEAHSRGASGSPSDVSPSRRTIKKFVSIPKQSQSHSSKNDINDNNMREWRNGIKLARRTLGPRMQSPTKCNCIEAPRTNRHMKEKLSTFWDYNGHRRNGKATKSIADCDKQNNATNKCFDRKNNYSRSEIRKYIRDKQKLYREKESESHSRTKCNKDRTHSSLVRLNHDQSYDCIESDVDHDDHFCVKEDNRCQTAPFSQRRSRMNQPIYDELRGDGMFDYRGSKKLDLSRNQSSMRFKNSFNSTVDSGFETGEWIQTITPDAMKLSNDVPLNKTSYIPPKAIRETVWKRESKQKSPTTTAKCKNEYYNTLQKEFKDGISAYDASSENELGNNKEVPYLKVTPPPSPLVLSDTRLKSPVHNLTQLRNMFDFPDYYIESNGNTSQLQLIDGKLSISLPNCYAEFSPQPSFRRSQDDFRSPDSSQICLVDELKEALLDAQRQLNPHNFETIDSVSERISRAVQNFIKTQNKGLRSSHSSNSDNKLPLGQSKEMENNSKILQLKSEISKLKNENKKDHLSTECEATEIEFEQCKQVNRVIENGPSSIIRQEIKEQISEERNSLSADSEPSEIIDDAMKESIAIKIATKTKDLESRREKANELIKLTREFKKENKRVKLLEKKACQFSKQYLQDSLFHNKNHESIECTKPTLGSISITKVPRHPTSHNSKDSGRTDIKEYNEHQLSPRAKLGEEMNKDDNCTTEQSLSGLSDVDEPTISEVTTTLSDRSELEARLVALKTEMAKKHQLVALLKMRQKEMKRDKIKQKEITLQKQIEMYDDYIVKLQDSITELDNKADDAASDDSSHTLTGSATNIHELESKIEHVDTDVFENEQVMPKNEDTFEDIYNKCAQNHPDTANAPLDDIVKNNVAIAGENMELDSMIESKTVDTVNSVVDTNIKNSLPPKVDLTSDSTFDGNKVFENHTNNEELDEMIESNSCDNDIYDDRQLDPLYLKEVSLTVEDGNNQTILDELLSEHLKIETQDSPLYYQVTIENLPEIKEDHEKRRICDKPETQEKELYNQQFDNQNLKQHDTSTEIFILEDNDLDLSSENSVRETISYSVENNSAIKHDVDEFVPNIQINASSRRDSLEEIKNHQSIFPTNSCGGDDDSSISDTKSVTIFEENNYIEIDQKQEIKIAKQSVNDIQDPDLTTTPFISSITNQQALVSISESNLNYNNDIGFKTDLLNSAEIEQIVESLLNTMISGEIERLNLDTATNELEPNALVSVVKIVDFQSTSFFTPQVTIHFPTNEENLSQCSLELQSDDLCQFSKVNLCNRSDIIDSPISLTNVYEQQPERSVKRPELTSIIDKELLTEKIRWLIPLKSQYLDSHINSAIQHFFNAKQNNNHVIVEEMLKEASQTLPDLYSESIPVVTDTEIRDALFDPSKQHSFIDKRIIFHLIKEIFSEIYSSERYLPQMPWIHSSFMIKLKNFTTWKGDKPPETYDLVSQIVRERIYQLFDQKNMFFENVSSLSKQNASHSKITKWCIERQKDQVDKILINDLRKEENDWVYYDEAEEEVKIQIAEDVFNFLITDTISWLRSTLSQT